MVVMKKRTEFLGFVGVLQGVPVVSECGSFVPFDRSPPENDMENEVVEICINGMDFMNFVREVCFIRLVKQDLNVIKAFSVLSF